MNTVAIIGKPNVGKSTLFNRIIRDKKSIVNNEPGVTRDRIYGNAEWLTRKFEIIDTGGLTVKDETFQQNINNQVCLALDEASVIVFIVSYKYGIDHDDIYVAKMLKKYAKTKKIIFVANMAETYKDDDLGKFYSLGFGKPIMVSAEHGIGVGDLLDEIVKNFPKDQKQNNSELTFCIIGRPNVGKSSLTNAILKENRVIVSDVAGTTRDSIDVDFKYHNKIYTLIDTAGIRRKGKIGANSIEKYSIMRVSRAIERSKIILLVLDGSCDFTEQDEVIGGMCYQANIPTIILVNKIDLFEYDDKKLNQIKKNIRDRFKYLNWAPIIFVSALQNKKINNIFDTIDKINEQVNKKVSTSLLNDVILQAQMIQQAPLHKGARVNISYATQVESQIPTFVIFCSNVNSLHFSYARYIENKIREAFGFDIVPITLFWKDKNAKTRGVKIDE